MKLGAVIAAAVVAVGVGQAEAATTVDYDLSLRYDGTTLTDLIYFEKDSESTEVFNGPDTGHDATSNFRPSLFSNLLIGDIIRFVATVVFPDDQDDFGSIYDNGGSAPVCQFGPIDCTYVTLSYIFNDGASYLTSGYGDVGIYGHFAEGGSIRYESLNTGMRGENGFPYLTSEDGNYYFEYRDEYANFTVVDQPAPVPLPATAALLPLGLGALAMMRKRRRA